MNDLELYLLGLLPPAAILAGGILWWVAAWRHRQGDAGIRLSSFALQAVGSILLIVGVFVMIVVTTQPAAVLALPLAGIVVVILVRRYYETEQQSMLWGLLAAAERGVPLTVAAQAFAQERNDRFGRKAAQLADYLEAGVPFGLALQRARYSMTTELWLAAHMGHQTGTLGPALRQVLDRSRSLDAATTPLAGRMIYLGFIVVNTLVVQTFLLSKFIPTIRALHQADELALPRSTQSLIAVAELRSPEFLLWFAMISVGLLCLGFGLFSLVQSVRNVPLVRRFWWRVECSLVMRWLATGVRQGRPILETLRLLAGYYPHSAMRHALDRAAKRVEQGSHWCDSLVRGSLIRKNDSAVFKAAERAGNLQWALQEVSDSAVRRWSYRVQFWSHAVFPLLLILVSSGVLVVLLAYFTPLLTMIQHSS